MGASGRERADWAERGRERENGPWEFWAGWVAESGPGKRVG